MKKNPYENFNKYILRTPLFPITLFKELTQNNQIKIEDLAKIFNRSDVRESIFLASPELYFELDKEFDNNVKEKNDSKLKYAFLKYFSRMTFRCTPFGLFAGCSVGEFANHTKVLLSTLENKRHTRFDMNFLVSLSKELSEIKIIKDQIQFFPNSSIYKIASSLRFVEYQYVNGRRHHRISSVVASEYLEKILEAAKGGRKLSELARLIVCEDITLEEASDFIDQLIINQLLISNLEPTVSGPDFLNQIINIIEPLNEVESIVELLKSARNRLNSFDHIIGNIPKNYEDLYIQLKKVFEVPPLKFMFQTDLYVNAKSNFLDQDIVRKVKKAVTVLNKLTIADVESEKLNYFASEFEKRYGDREMPLSTVLDVEIGIGYSHENVSGFSPLIDDISLPEKLNTYRNLKICEPGEFLRKKILDANILGDYILELQDKDFEKFNFNWDDLPDTFSCMIQLVNIDNSQKIRFGGINGSSAANLIGRFCHGNRDIDNVALEIVKIESEINKNKILAEIVHLPESRVGNILMRPNFRNFEIPYLAKSISTNQIGIDDILIYLDEKGRIRLKSKSYKKEIIPRLTNSHNFQSGALPIYHFLCDMQTHGLRQNLHLPFSWLTSNLEFVPRIEYQSVIFREATWNLNSNHLKTLLEKFSDNHLLLCKIKDFRKKYKMPQFVKLVERDNELLINLENIDSLKMFLTTVEKRSHFVIKEFLFNGEQSVKEGEMNFTNQFIIPFYNKERLNKNLYEDK